MIEILISVAFVLLMVVLLIVVVRVTVLEKRSITGKPPIPVFFFILAKLLVLVNLLFLLFRVMDIPVTGKLFSSQVTDWAGLFFLYIGIFIILLSSVKLSKYLIFGLQKNEDHQLQTTGIYAVSRHPFYLGFILVLFASCLLNSDILNILAFAGSWTIHHFIMIKEEEHLLLQYGDLYKHYTDNVNRYFTFPGAHKESLKESMHHK